MFVIISYMHVLGVGENEKKTTNVYSPAAWCKLHSPNAVLEWHQQKLQSVCDGDFYTHSQIVKSEQHSQTEKPNAMSSAALAVYEFFTCR
jgi:hypothetical protein